MFKTFKQTRQKLNDYKDIPSFLRALPSSFLEKVSFILLTALVLSPLVRLFISPLIINPTSLTFTPHTLHLGGIWYTLLLQIGYLSLITGLLAFFKAFIHVRDESLSMKQVLKTHVSFVFLIAFMLYSMMSVFFSSNIALSIRGTAYRKEGLMMMGAYLGFISVAALIKNPVYLKRLAMLFTGGSGILALLTITDFKVFNQAFTLSQSTSVFHNANHYGYYLLMALLTSAMLFIHSNTQNKLISFYALFIFSLNTLALLINTSVGPFLGVLAGLIVLTGCLLILKQGHIKPLFILWVVFAVIATYNNIQTNHLTNEASGLSQDVQDVISGDEAAPRAGSGRWHLWVLSLNYTLDAPITGHGLDNLGHLYALDEVDNDRPHNEFLQHLAFTGIIGLILYIAVIMTYGLTFLFNLDKLTLLDTTFFALISGYVVSSLFGNTMYYTTPFYLVILTLGIIHLQRHTKKVVNIQT